MELIYDLERSTFHPLSLAAFLSFSTQLGKVDSDSITESITEWQHFEDPDWKELPEYPMTSLQNPIYSWIRSFLTLQNIPFGCDILLDRAPKEHEYPSDDANGEAMRQWRERETFKSSTVGIPTLLTSWELAVNAVPKHKSSTIFGKC